MFARLLVITNKDSIMSKSTVAKEVKSVWNMVLTQLSEGVINGYRVATNKLEVAPIWRFSKEVEGVHLFTHGNREYWVISEKDTDVVTKGKGFFSSRDVEVKVRNFYLVPKTTDHKGRPCYNTYLTNLDTLVKQGILRECWGDITKAEMSAILGTVVKMLAEAQQIPTSKFKGLAKTLKIGAISGADKEGKKKAKSKETDGLLQQVLDGLKEMQKQMASTNEVKAEAPAQEPVVAPVVKTPAAQPATSKSSAKQPRSTKKPTVVSTTKSTVETAVSQLSEQLAELDLLGEQK